MIVVFSSKREERRGMLWKWRKADVCLDWDSFVSNVTFQGKKKNKSRQQQNRNASRFTLEQFSLLILCDDLKLVKRADNTEPTELHVWNVWWHLTVWCSFFEDECHFILLPSSSSLLYLFICTQIYNIFDVFFFFFHLIFLLHKVVRPIKNHRRWNNIIKVYLVKARHENLRHDLFLLNNKLDTENQL